MLTPKDFREIDVDHMLDLARVAEKRIRVSRRGDYEFYNPEQWQRGKRIAEIINYLPAAIKSGDIQVWYQPQVDYEKGRITGAEALCRWDHSKLGWLYPYDFFPRWRKPASFSIWTVSSGKQFVKIFTGGMRRE